MASIERTIYPRFRGPLSQRELAALYRPTPRELRFVEQHARSAKGRLTRLVLLKCHQQLGYLPAVTAVPRQITRYVAAWLGVPETTALLRGTKRWRQHYRDALHAFLRIQPYSRGGHDVAATVIRRCAHTMSDPADLINAAIEKLIEQRFVLPGYSTLDRLAASIRREVHEEFYASVSQGLCQRDVESLNAMLRVKTAETESEFNRLKASPGRPSLHQMRRWLDHLAWLDSVVSVDTCVVLQKVTHTKVRQFAAEARSLELGDVLDMGNARKRQTLLVCLLHQARTQTRDDLVTMFLKRMRRTHKSAEERLHELRDENRALEEKMMAAFSQVVDYAAERSTNAVLGKRVRDVLAEIGGVPEIQEQYRRVAAYHGNDYLPLLWDKHRAHRAAVLKLLRLLRVETATQDPSLLEALHCVHEHQDSRRGVIERRVDLSFASRRWRALVKEERDGETVINRRQLEVCVLSYVADGLRCGDLFVPGSEAYADYREQLLPWEECKDRLAESCKILGLPADAAGFAKDLKARLTCVAKSVDAATPENEDFTIDDDGCAHLTRLTAMPAPDGADDFIHKVRERMPERHLLDVLKHVHDWTSFTRHFGPPSGADPKMQDPLRRYLFAVFGYGCNLGPSQTARHSLGEVTLRVLHRVHKQHITTSHLEAVMRDIIAQYKRCLLPTFWGDDRVAVADGTHMRLRENNLLGETHIRYGAYGGIAYHHISDTYIALFTHLISCGVWEGVYILDGILKNTSDLQPDTVCADTQGQAEPIFGLALLLGIKLMPRMRNWSDVAFYRPDGRVSYDNIDVLFTRTVNWRLIKTHWKDMMQVVISIQAGKVLPSMLLRKLSSYGRNNKLYRAFREVGRVARTLFLLEYISDKALRRRIHASTTKVESFNDFCDWIGFGGDVLTSGDPVENEKRIKYTTVVANAVMLHNVVDLTAVLVELGKEGYPITRQLLSLLSPYMTGHIQRFGQFVIDADTVAPPLMPGEIKLTESSAGN